MKKIKKMIRNPNLFFYDFFKKRISANVIKKEHTIKQTSIIHDIPSFEKVFQSIVEFAYKGKLYIKEKERLVFLLQQLSMLNLHLQIVCDFSKQYIYNSNVVNYKNLLRAFKNVNNVYIEIHDCKNNKIAVYDIIFVTFAENTYYSNADIRKISSQHTEELKKDKHDFDIDIVYTYVDSKDSSWRIMYEQTFNDLDFDIKRYEAHDELKFSLRSVNQFMPWVRKIFIVSNCARPEWLNESSRVVWIDHSEIATDVNLLPTFNSHGIESYLHRIPDLSENFIYFNDDVLLNKQVDKTFFYKYKNMSINFCEQYDSVFWNLETMGNEIGYKNASNNVQAILYERFNYIPRYLMQHAPHALRKSVLHELEKFFWYQFEVTRKNKVRSKEDINILSFLYPHYSLLTGRSVHVTARSAIIRESNYTKIIRESYKYHFLCLNEYNESDERFVRTIEKFLNERYFVIPEWENSVISK